MSTPTPMPSPVHDAVWISGSVGAGKTTLAEVVGEKLERRSVPGAVVDVDRLRSCWPSPQGDPYRTNIATENLRAVSTTFRAAGAQVIVAAGVIEEPAEVETQARALGASRLLLVRLVIDPSIAADRLDARHVGDEAARRRHRTRHPELARILDRADFPGELVLDSGRRDPADLAGVILAEVLGERGTAAGPTPSDVTGTTGPRPRR